MRSGGVIYRSTNLASKARRAQEEPFLLRVRMNDLLNESAALTMSSREISQFVGSSHDSVLKTIRSLIDRGIVFGNETPYVHYQNGQTYSEFLLDYRNTMVVVSGYSPEVRARIIDRWQELESSKTNAIAVPQTMAQALRLAADQAEQIEQQQAALALAAPKVDFFDKVVDRTTLMTATQVGQKVGMSAVALNKCLDAFDVYSSGVKRARVFKQWFIDKGYGELKQTELGYSQPLFTTAGEAWIVEKLTGEGVI